MPSQKWSKTYAACGLKIENSGAKKTRIFDAYEIVIF